MPHKGKRCTCPFLPLLSWNYIPSRKSKSKRLKRHLYSQPDPCTFTLTDRRSSINMILSCLSCFSCWSHISSCIFCVSLDCGFRPAGSPGALPSERGGSETGEAGCCPAPVPVLVCGAHGPHVNSTGSLVHLLLIHLSPLCC